VSVSNVAPDNGGTPFGVVARLITRYIRKEGGVVVKTASNVKAPGAVPRVIESSTTDPALMDFVAQVLP
jgi:hypothetical protein